MRPARSAAASLTLWLSAAWIGVVLSTAALAAEGPGGAEPWLGSPLTADPATVLRAAEKVPKPPEAGGVVLLEEVRFVFDERGRREATYRYVCRVDTAAAAEGWSSVQQGWSPWYQSRPEIRARVITPDGAAHELDPATLTEAPLGGDNAKVYDDRRSLRAPLSGAKEGSVVEIQFHVRDSSPMFEKGVVQSYALGTDLPVRRTIVEFVLPASLPHRYVVRAAPGLETSRSEENGTIRLHFEAGPLAALEDREPYAPADFHPRPLVAFATGESWQAVAASYAEIVQGQIAAADLKPLLGEAPEPPGHAATSGDRLVLVNDLLAKLHAEVRYTGIEFAEASIVPRTPAETLKRKYGDCKDQAALLVAMLRARGLPASVALLRTGTGEDVEPDLPGLGAFDHAIVFVPGENDSPLWIDPTDEYARAGELAPSVQGRLALIASPTTKELVRIPPQRAENNAQREMREFFLAESGPARIVERTELSGTFERSFRTWYAGEEKKWKDQLARYVELEYLAKVLGPTSHLEPRDLSQPFFLLLEAHQAGRGQTERTEAAAALTVGIMTQTLDPLMGALKEADKGAAQEGSEPEKETAGEEVTKPGPEVKKRVAAIRFPEPFVVERAYRITPPPGYALRQLPDGGRETVGPATFEKEFAAGDDGVVRATLRFTMEATPIPPEEAEAFFRFVTNVRETKPILVMFDQLGETHLAGGRIREALAEFNRLVAQHPREGLHHAQVASALLAGGMGEAAREEARKATDLDPDSAAAWRTTGWVLQHDLVGRLRRKGFDLEGAQTAYRKAKRLGPEEHIGRVDLAILLEHDAEGRRYTPDSKLAEAIVEYRALRDEKSWPQDLDASQMDQNYMAALSRHGDFAAVEAHARALNSSATRNAWLLAAIAALRGPTEALRESNALAFNSEARRAALATAGVILMQCRRYEPAAALLVEGAKGAPNGAIMINLSETLMKTARHQQPPVLATGPGSLVPRLFAVLGHSEADEDERGLKSLFTRESLDTKDVMEGLEAIRLGRRKMISTLEQQGFPLDVVLDILPQVMEVSTEGADGTGYRIRTRGMTPQGQASFTLYAVSQDGEYRAVQSKSDAGAIGLQALRLLEAGGVEAACRWLDWARDEVSSNPGEDPYGGHPFHRLYSKGHDSTPDELRMAAASLLDAGPGLDKAIAALRRGREEAPSDQARLERDLALAWQLYEAEEWEELVPLARSLLEKQPKSASAFRLVYLGLNGLKQWDESRKLAEERLALIPDDRTAIRALSELADYGKIPRRPEASLRRLAEIGRAEATDYNQMAWEALAEGRVDDEAVEQARRASLLTNQSEYAVLHTLAALYAELGRTTEARELILKAMEASGRDEPTPEDWYVFGRIAEQYGVPSAAEKAYARLKPPERPESLPMSTYTLAQKRLAVIAAAPTTR